MANIAWPLNPSVGDTYTFNSITYRWTGTTWSPGTAPISLTGPTGPSGSVGSTGSTGATGPTSFLLNTLTASNSANLEDTTSFTSANGDTYLIVFINLVPATDNVTAQFQYYTAGTLRTANYDYLIPGGYKAGFDGVGQGTEYAGAAASIIMCGTGASLNAVGNNADKGFSGHVIVAGANIAFYKHIHGNAVWQTPVGAPSSINSAVIGARYTGDTSDFTGFRVKFGSGNITSGQIKIYKM